MVDQKTWRMAGVVVLVMAGLMAWYAMDSGLLRDSVLHLSSVFTDRSLEEPGATLSFVILYWGVFGVAIFAAIFLALIDIRFIRLRHALERRDLLREAVSQSTAKGTSALPPNGEDS